MAQNPAGTTPATQTVKKFPYEKKSICEGIVNFTKSAQIYTHQNFGMRDRLEIIDRSYQREDNWTREGNEAQNAVNAGNKTKRTNITVPIVMPQVEAAVTYLSEVFLSGYPIFAVGSAPEFDDAALQLETIIADQSIVAGWARQLAMFFRDGKKYNIHAMECTWDTIDVAGTSKEPLAGMKEATSIAWQGNILRRMDMYNTFFDPRVAPADIHNTGEFAGYSKILSRIEMKRLIVRLGDKITTEVANKALEAGGFDQFLVQDPTGLGYYVPQINPDAFEQNKLFRGNFDWLGWATDTAKNRLQYKNAYQVTKIYGRIIPSDFELFTANYNTPQIWKFLVVNNQVLLYAERCDNVHDKLPIIFGQPMEDGLDYQTKSLAQNVQPFQDLATAAINAGIASKRRLVMDRGLYDPSRVAAADINSDNPSAKIPVRPAAYGKPLSDAYYAIPYRDDLSANVAQEAELYIRYANLISGQNPAQQGQFVKGNKTRSEFQDVMGHSNAPNKLSGLLTEHQVMTPLKEIIKSNIIQYQGPNELYNHDTSSTVKIDPKTLRDAVSAFKLSDGILPADKMLNTEEFQVAAQVLGSSPQLSAGYRMVQVFSHLFKQRGVDLRPFEKTPAEMQYEQQLNAWQGAAIEAAKTGAAFSTPMPQPPDQGTIDQQMLEMRKRRGLSLQQMIDGVQQAQAASTGRAGSTTGQPLPV